MKNKMKRATALVLATASVSACTGCDLIDSIFNPSNGLTNPPSMNNAFAIGYTEDANAIYDSIPYNFRMFYGKYVADGVTDRTLSEEGKAKYMQVSSAIKEEWSVDQKAVLPFRVEAGPNCINSPINYISGFNWMMLSFLADDGKVHTIPCAYTVLERKLSLHPLKEYSYDGYTKNFNYTFSELLWEYDFSFQNGKMILSLNDQSITLTAEDLTPNGEGVSLPQAKWREGTEKFSQIDNFSIQGSEVAITLNDDKVTPDMTYQFADNGLLNLQWLEDRDMRYAQVAYFYCDDDGLILADADRIFDYTDRPNDKFKTTVNINVAAKDAEKYEKLSKEKREELNKNLNSLYEQLQKQLLANGIEATIDAEHGEISLNSLVLFAKDKSDISDAGDQLLRRFLSVYTSVIFSGSYENLVKEVIIEGYTDPSGAADYNLMLSEKRANAVKDFCLSENSGISDENREKLSNMLTAVGMGFANTILDENGQVNVEACRRVAFRFMMNLDI